MEQIPRKPLEGDMARYFSSVKEQLVNRIFVEVSELAKNKPSAIMKIRESIVENILKGELQNPDMVAKIMKSTAYNELVLAVVGKIRATVNTDKDKLYTVPNAIEPTRTDPKPKEDPPRMPGEAATLPKHSTNWKGLSGKDLASGADKDND